MGQDEFLEWVEFYKLFPFDDLHRIHRPAALIATAGADSAKRQAAIDAATDWLQPEPRNAGLSASDVSMMRALGFKQKGQ